MANINVIIEGAEGKSHFRLWEEINRHIYKGRLTLISSFGFSNIIKVLKDRYNVSDLFIIDIDNSLDNTAVVNELIELSIYMEYKLNVFNLGLQCFEDTMLSFNSLKEWVYSSETRRSKLIEYRCSILDAYRASSNKWDYNDVLAEFIVKVAHKNKDEVHLVNKEHLASYVLSNFTYNSGFRVTKGDFGDCWSEGCYSEKCGITCKPNMPKHRVCGLHEICSLCSREKIEHIYRYTKLNDAMAKCKETFISAGYNLAEDIVVI